ncbi:Flp pilus assembly protein CpaB (plasmid) [Photobacterium sp. GJ3]|uniref:Flp pilus assembly protein CpaB n=1 Tax=Photobacterium sp. GJ3 TaxID=2829502 RepID=UPI001B8BBF95|nr:Flp pilus assembly protein CpaB [Photobacterium sp. GJ3]QUJ69747.1 Flp pilus assembly protein CpaB [Photobacterium sp. GJ3]
MQGRTLKIAAAVLLALALLIGWYGVTLSGRSATVTAVPAVTVEKPKTTVWTFVTDIPQNAVLDEAMLVPVQVSDATAQDINNVTPYLGRQFKHEVAQGARLQASMLQGHLPIAQSLAPGYRAIAIQSSDLTTAGGHVHPGYRVDVIYLVRANKESGENSTARRILSNVEVLAVGDELSFDGKETEKKVNDKARTVVLAVPASDTPQLMLAETTGQLRLAVVGTKDQVPDVVIPSESDSLLAQSPVPNLVPQFKISSQKTVSTMPVIPSAMTTAPSHSTVKEPLSGKSDDSYVISLKTLGGYREAEVEVKKPTPVKYRYVAPKVEVYQGEKRTLVRTSH